MTDIATGWTENRAVQNKAQKWVVAALEDIAKIMPFPLLGVDSDYADLRIMPTSDREPLLLNGSHSSRSA